MKRMLAVLLVVVGVAVLGGAARSLVTVDELLAAMPILERGLTRIALMPDMGEPGVSVFRAVTPSMFIRAEAVTDYNLAVRLLAPPVLVPAFFAIEVDMHCVTGLMTLFLGPVAIDLGRSWVEPARWVWIQCAFHPRLTVLLGGREQDGVVSPQVGWRLFPTGSARWEIAMTFGNEGICLVFGGIL